MNARELTDTFYNIKDIINNDMESEKTKIRRIKDLVEWVLGQPDFPVPEQELIEFLNAFGDREFRNTCTGKISGEFCYAEYVYSDDEDIVFQLKYGVNNGDENYLYTDEYRISVYDFENSKTFEEMYCAVQEN